MKKFIRKTGGLTACLLLLVVWMGCQRSVQSDLDEREANEILLVLAEVGLSAEKRGGGPGGWRVDVDKGNVAQAFQAMAAAGLPRKRHPGFRGVYKERGLVPDRLEAQALFLSALQDELASTLEGIKGVISARVHASIPAQKRSGRHQEAGESRASVLVTHWGDTPPLSREDVRHLVANAVEGLDQERVAVLFVAQERKPMAARLQVENSFGLAGIRPFVLALAAFLALAGVYMVFRKRLAGLAGERLRS